MRSLLAALFSVVMLAGCSLDDEVTDTAGPSDSGDSSSQEFPDVVEAELSPETDGTYSVDVTVSSPYDTPERYADGWRVLDPDGEVLGEHELAHDHANEQPFTRTQTGLEIPDDIDTVTVEGRDLTNGYGGETVEVPVPNP